MRNGLAVALLAVVVLTASTTANAQRVRGTVTDSATGERISGAVVTLTDSAGAFLARSIADADGKFAVLRIVGTKRMRVVRIGFRPAELAIGNDTIANVRMQPVASLLSAVAASGRRVCPNDAGTSVANALELWEQARAGLLASVVSREAAAPKVRIRTSERTFEPIRKRMIHDSVEVKDVVVDRSFVAARPAWAFAESGYLREGHGGDREYFAPDEEVLLDPSFAGTHCMHVIDGRGPRAADVGIAFDPVDDAARDTLVDITGVLWLARIDLALQSLEFHYTNLESQARDAGGEVFFTVMPNGAPMIEHWTIHSPVLAYDEEEMPNGVKRSLPRRPERRNVRVIAYNETSGMVGFATWPDGKTWHGALPRIIGYVDDLNGEPVAGVSVWMRETRDTVRTNAEGRFEMPYVFPGIYTIEASDSVLAGEGIARSVPLRFGLFNPGDSRAFVKYYPRADVFSIICPANSYKPGTGVLLAKVLDSRGNPAAKADLVVETQQLLVAGDTITRPQSRHGTAGDDGRFVICGISRDRPMIVRAFKGAESAGVSVDQWKEEVASVTILLKTAQP